MSASRCLWAFGLALLLLAGGCALRHAPPESGLGDSPALTHWPDRPWATGQTAPGFFPGLDRSKAADGPVRRTVADERGTESSNVRLASGTILGAPLKALSSGVATGAEKISEAFAPSVDEPADPTSLASKAQPTPQLFLAMARLAEQSGRMDEAEQRYHQALDLDAKDLDVLVAYARMKDRQGRLDDAIELYQRAAKAHPNNARVYNDLGLCLARRSQLDAAVGALERSVQLAPKEPLYRNNIATVLVEQGNVDAAFTHMAAVHPQAVAYYNIGYLLYKRGQPKAAATLFTQALKVDPSLKQARAWLDRLNGGPAAAPVARRGAAADEMLEDPAIEGPDLRAMRRQAMLPGRRTPTIYPPPRETPRPVPSTNEAPMPVVAPPEVSPERLLPNVRQLPPVSERNRRRGQIVPQSYEDAPLPADVPSEAEPGVEEIESSAALLPPEPDDVPAASPQQKTTATFLPSQPEDEPPAPLRQPEDASAPLPPEPEEALPAPLPDDVQGEAVPLDD